MGRSPSIRSPFSFSERIWKAELDNLIASEQSSALRQVRTIPAAHLFLLPIDATSTPMPEYFLPSHVHMGCREGALVFLDLKRDDYILVDGDAAASLLAISSLAPELTTSSLAFAAALAELLECGLLTTDPSAGKPVSVTQREAVFEQLVDPDNVPQVRITWSDLWHFIVACTISTWRLRFYHLADTVTRIQQRKNVHHGPHHELDLARARDLTIKFQRLRCFFPRNYVCLYDSLALLEFLARHLVFPTWVFGVNLEPWGAHCWVQDAGVTFNDDVEEIANYTPVMAI